MRSLPPCKEHDGECACGACGASDSLGGGAAPDDDHIDVEVNQLPGRGSELVRSTRKESPFEAKILALDIAKFPQSLLEGVIKRIVCRGWREIADSIDLPRLLPLGGDRRGEETTPNRGQECPPVHHSIP